MEELHLLGLGSDLLQNSVLLVSDLPPPPRSALRVLRGEAAESAAARRVKIVMSRTLCPPLAALLIREDAALLIQ